MMLPVAILLSEWRENQIQPEVMGFNDIEEKQWSPPPQKRFYIETPSNARKNKVTQARPNCTYQKRLLIAKSEQTHKVPLQRQQDNNLKLILSKVDKLMRPNYKFKKFVPQDFQTANYSEGSVSYRKLYRKPPPPPKSHLYPSDNETDPNQSSPSVDCVRNRPAAPPIPKSNRRKVGHLRSQSNKGTQYPSASNLHPSSYTSCALAEYFHFKKVSNRLPSLPEGQQSSSSIHSLPEHQDNAPSPMVCMDSSEKKSQEEELSRLLPLDKQNTNSSNLCHNKSKKQSPMPVCEEHLSPTQESQLQSMQKAADSASYLPFPQVLLTKISLLIRDANTKLNHIINGLALDMTAPFEYFDDGVFVEEIVMHKILYASRLMFRDQKSDEEYSKPNEAATKPPLLTCNQLEKALSSKLSAHARPFTFKRQTSTERDRSRPKISMESFMEFLSCMSEITIKSDSFSYANFVDPLLTPLIGEREDHSDSEESVTRMSVQTYVDDLQGQQLTEEEEQNGCAAGMVPIGSELRRSTDSIPNPESDVKIVYQGRDILEMGMNLKDQWKDIDRWQVGPNVKGPEDDRQDRDKEWKRSHVKRCENCSFYYHEH